jgi:hypothetical protein
MNRAINSEEKVINLISVKQGQIENLKALLERKEDQLIRLEIKLSKIQTIMDYGMDSQTIRSWIEDLESALEEKFMDME